MKTILQIDSSVRTMGSLTRQVTQLLANKLNKINPEISINYRDLAKGLPLIDEKWINANFTAEQNRNEEAKNNLKISDHLVAELQQAEYIVIGSPTYNFNISAYLKAWVDLIARAKVTFQYTENGPEGLLKNKKAYLVIASGGVEIGSDEDFVSHYLKRIMAFIGITDVSVIDATKIDLINNSELQIEALM